jgi:hypothetical protein
MNYKDVEEIGRGVFQDNILPGKSKENIKNCIRYSRSLGLDLKPVPPEYAWHPNHSTTTVYSHHQ